MTSRPRQSVAGLKAEAPIDTIRRRKLSEDVAARIEAMIVSGDVPAGEPLPSERDLMLRFGVGRPAIREALFSLHKMGLVAVQAGGRARVTVPTPAVLVETLSGPVRHMLASAGGVRSLQDARAFFEIGLARHAAVHATATDLDDLRAALEANRLALGDVAKFEATDVAFHRVLAVIPRNPIFSGFHQAMIGWLTEQRHITLKARGQKDLAFKAHEQITKAIVARDPERAERLMRDHLAEVVKTYWRVREAER